jgi:pimeloyl-ACP methyl ester carboxylesterase
MRVLLLPGFYGTGELFAPLQAAFDTQLNVQAIRYADEESLDDYVACVEALLPERNAILVAESFSGPIALALMARSPERFRCAVLSATFAVSPYRSLAALARYLPSQLFGPSWIARLAIRHACLDVTVTADTLTTIDAVMRLLSPGRIKARFKLLAGVDVRALLPRVNVPILYLQAKQDRIVNSRLSRDLTDNLPLVEVQHVHGPHFLLQSQPLACARAIEGFIARMPSRY